MSLSFPARVVIALLTVGSVATAVWYTRRGELAAEPWPLVLNGNVDIRQVSLAFQGNDRIAGLHYQEGDRVQAGTALGELDRQRAREAVARAEARVAAQTQVLAALDAGTRPEEIRKLRAELQAAEILARNAERTSRRLRELVKKQLVAEEQADDAQANAEATRARAQSAREALDLAIAGPRKEDIAAARANLDATRAELALAEKDLADTTLYAPANGVIEARLLEPGDMASPQRAVFTLALDDPLWVRAYVAETDLGKLRPGLQAEVRTDSFPSKTYRGWVGYISPTAEFTPKSVETRELRTRLVYQVRVLVCNPQGELRLGMPATVTILEGATRPTAEPCSRP